MFQVWLQLHGGPGGIQIPALTERGPGRLLIRPNRVWNVFEPVLWHWCKWFTEVSTRRMRHVRANNVVFFSPIIL